MTTVQEVDVKQIVLSTAAFGPREIEHITGAISSNYSKYRELREAVAELEEQTERTPATSARLGVCQYLLGAYTSAIQTLSHADGGALTHFYLGKSFLALDRYAEAVTAYDSAHRAGYDAGIVTLAKAEALRYDKRPEEALKLLDSLSGAVEQTAEYLYQRSATVQAMGGSREEVIALPGTGRQRRWQPLRGVVRPGAGERPPRQRRAGPRAVRAGVAAVPLPRGHAAEPRDPVRGPGAVRAGQGLLSPHPRRLPVPPAGPALLPRRRRHPRHVLRRGGPPPPGPHEPGAQHPGHRLRALGPQPQLPAEDGHHDARRPHRDHRAGAACPARTSARPRWSRSARCLPPRAWNWASSPTRSARRRSPTTPTRCRPTSGPCWIARSPTSTSRCGPASAWSGSG